MAIVRTVCRRLHKGRLFLENMMYVYMTEAVRFLEDHFGFTPSMGERMLLRQQIVVAIRGLEGLSENSLCSYRPSIEATLCFLYDQYGVSLSTDFDNTVLLLGLPPPEAFRQRVLELRGYD